jgi:hypothetical protein
MAMDTVVGGIMKHQTTTVTFRGTRSSDAKIPTSSKLNTNSAQQLGRHCLMQFAAMSKNDRRIPNPGFS